MPNKPLTALLATGRIWLEDSLSRCLDDPSAAVVFASHGPMDAVQVDGLMAEAERHSLAHEDGMVPRKRMLNVLIEGLENIRHHAHDGHKEVSFAALVRDARGYRMLFGNAVPLATAALVTHRVGILNEMDEADLKEHYLKLLGNSARSEHGGAGLGLLTMARKSMRPITVRASKLNDEAAVLVVELRVGS